MSRAYFLAYVHAGFWIFESRMEIHEALSSLTNPRGYLSLQNRLQFPKCLTGIAEARTSASHNPNSATSLHIHARRNPPQRRASVAQLPVPIHTAPHLPGGTL